MQFTNLPLHEMAMYLVSQIEIELEMKEVSRKNKETVVNTMRKKNSSKSLELAKNLAFQIDLEFHQSTFESNETEMNDCDDESIDLLQENNPTDSELISREASQDSIEAKFSSSEPCLNSKSNCTSEDSKFSTSDSCLFSKSNNNSCRTRSTMSTMSCSTTSRSTMSRRSMLSRSSSNHSFRSLVSQLTERTSTSRHSEIEKGLMRQMEIFREEQANNRKLIEHKIRERDEAIKDMERTLMIKAYTVDALRDKLDTLRDQLKFKDELMDDLRDELDEVKEKYLREEQANDRNVIEEKIRQRDDAIETMEMALMIKADTVNALQDKLNFKDEVMDNLRDDLDEVKRKYRREKARIKSEFKASDLEDISDKTPECTKSRHSLCIPPSA